MHLQDCCPTRNPNGSIVALGEMLIDFVPVKPDMRLCEAGEITKTASGSAAIFACAAARLGASCGFLGKLGMDELSRMAADVISAQGVDLSHAVLSHEGQIGLAFIEYLATGRNYEYYRTNSVGSRFAAKDIDEASIAHAFALHIPGMLLELSEEMRGACLRAAQIAKQNGVLFSFDPNIRKELMKEQGAKERTLAMLSLADVIAPTLEEGRYITGKQGVGEVLRALHAMGPRVVALTRDQNGAVLSDGQNVVQADGINVEAIDPTGAGDTFAAALVDCVRRKTSLCEAAVFCNCAGTLTTMKRGVIGMALPNREQVEALVASGACAVREMPLSQADEIESK
ncbi:MAG: sugar kinase [Clostridia bacterium]